MKNEDAKVLTVNGEKFVSNIDRKTGLTDNINLAYTFTQNDAECYLLGCEDELGIKLEIKPLLDYYTPFIQ